MHFVLQALQKEVVSQASCYSHLLQLKEILFTAASRDDVAMMKLQLEQLDEHWRDLPQIINKRSVLQKRASNEAHWSARMAGVLCLILFNVVVQGKIIEETRTTLSVMLESRMSSEVDIAGEPGFKVLVLQWAK